MTARQVSLSVRPAEAADAPSWRELFDQYCAALGDALPDEVAEQVWQRIIGADPAIGCLLACDGAEVVGFANFVLHPHTWSLRPVCYLEDLFVAPVARGAGAGQRLIQALADLGKREGWRRVYWHTHETNYRARTLYDRLAPRTDYVRYDIDL